MDVLHTSYIGQAKSPREPANHHSFAVPKVPAVTSGSINKGEGCTSGGSTIGRQAAHKVFWVLQKKDRTGAR